MVIRAVVGGSLVPVGYTNRFRGITGYLFQSEDLRKYRPVPCTTVSPEGVLNYGEVAAVLGVGVPAILGLVGQGILQNHYRVSKRLFQAVACRGCPTFRGEPCGDIGSRQAIPSSQWVSGVLPEGLGDTAARDPDT